MVVFFINLMCRRIYYYYYYLCRMRNLQFAFTLRFFRWSSGKRYTKQPQARTIKSWYWFKAVTSRFLGCGKIWWVYFCFFFWTNRALAILVDHLNEWSKLQSHLPHAILDWGHWHHFLNIFYLSLSSCLPWVFGKLHPYLQLELKRGIYKSLLVACKCQ